MTGPSVKMTTGTLDTSLRMTDPNPRIHHSKIIMNTTDYGLDYIQLPKFNTCLAVGDKVLINELPGTILYIKDTELTLAYNGARWTMYLSDIQTFERTHTSNVPC